MPKIPKAAQELIEVVGQAATLELIAAYGGMNLAIPARWQKCQWLIDAIGRDAALQLWRTWQGGRIYIPKWQVKALADRDRQIRADRAGGLSFNDLAAKWQLTHQRLYQILGSDRPIDLDAPPAANP